MKKVLSIIIPSYNMEGYLSKCLNSLLVPNINDLEIIIVNDGSKDNTLTIAREYQMRFPDSIKVIDKENGNYGSCINRGLLEAIGKYVKILDADDYFNSDELTHFICFLTTCECDLVLTDYSIVDERDNKYLRAELEPTDGKVLNRSDLFNYLLRSKYIDMHSFTYKMSVFEGMNYHQTEGISYTDTEWIFLPLHEVCSGFVKKIDLYQYLKGRAGQTMEKRSLVRNIGSLITVIKNIICYYERVYEDLPNSLKKLYQRMITDRIVMVYRLCLISGYPSRNQELIEFNDWLISNKYASDFSKSFDDSNLFWKIKFKYMRYWQKRGCKDNIFLFKVTRLLSNLI